MSLNLDEDSVTGHKELQLLIPYFQTSLVKV